MKEIEKCDIILAECSEKARGVYFEVGYAKALGKKVMIVHKNGADLKFLKGIADKIVCYNDLDELERKFKEDL